MWEVERVWVFVFCVRSKIAFSSVLASLVISNDGVGKRERGDVDRVGR